MSSDNQQNALSVMNHKIANDALQRYFIAEEKGGKRRKEIVKTSQKSKTSTTNTLDRLGILTHFAEPEKVLDIIDKSTYEKKNKETKQMEVIPYSHEYKKSFGKTVSAIAQFLTTEQKVAVMDKYWDEKGDHNSRNKKMRYNTDQKLKAYDVNIMDEYKAFNAQGYATDRHYQPHAVLFRKLLDLETAFQNKDLNQAKVLYQYQFVVTGLIYLLADRSRRLDIPDTMLEDGDDVNVVLRTEEGVPTGIFIKKAKKTCEPTIFLPFTDDRLVRAVKTLMDIRIKRNQTHLFLKTDGDVAKDVHNWFSDTFKKVMANLGVGEGLNMLIFRLAYGIKLSDEHDGTFANEKRIEDKMGHSFRTHQMYYKLTALENNVVEPEE
ncbi:hypothetical protein HK097_005882 [Rhizophlyctis rosea]|uniref:Uncharacterized protein n=1 Tax=Rhizophlyctis rosea TaxID=64517 RepID=A0AAD5X2B8_9FUNG|nr:hypothetical protein HK097_005882 [Rhizophlyctis rosea]